MNFLIKITSLRAASLWALPIVAGLQLACADEPLTAKMWAAEAPDKWGTAGQEFSRWQTSPEPEGGTVEQLTEFRIPARDGASMVRVRGVFKPSVTGEYAFRLIGEKRSSKTVDSAQLRVFDPATGGWMLAQKSGYSDPIAKRMRLRAGEARPFEFWTMGDREIAVLWRIEAPKSEKPGDREVIGQWQRIPGSNLGPRVARPDDLDGDGIRDSWKLKTGLSRYSESGDAGPWGDPDGDGITNWREQQAGADPLKADAEVTSHAGVARWEIWHGMQGSYVFDLTRSLRFPGPPDEVRYVRGLTGMAAGGQYGSRLRAVITAPVTGDYTFSLTADDTAELWLGSSASWRSRQLVARVDQAGNFHRWHRNTKEGRKGLFPEQTHSVTLHAGQEYYVEVLHKQGYGPDHFGVAWTLPGSDSPELIDYRHLRSWMKDPEDEDDDGLPDAWQHATGLTSRSVPASSCSAYADADYDGLSNWREWKGGTNPLMKDRMRLSKALTCESWSGIVGRTIADLVADERFPGRPDHVTFIDNLDFSSEGSGYGARLRGYLTPPEDGEYEFSLAGNNSCVLYLSDSEDKFAKRLVASTGSGTSRRHYHLKVRQRSGPITLEGGKRYYIEAIVHKASEDADENDGPRQRARKEDHLSVAWKRPGRSSRVIEADYFSSYETDPSDLDDDDLPDSWELEHGLDVLDPGGDQGGWGDPDGDGLSNFAEFQKSLDPTVQDVHGTPGIALWEYWEVRGGRYARLLANSSYPKNPTGREWMYSLEGPQNFGQHFISRMRALVIAPESGGFTFAVAANHEAKLWFGEDGTRQSRRLIANSDSVDFRSWDESASQQSEPIQLEKGKRYFIEVRHMENSATDHMSVAWKGPGMEDFEVIGGEALIAYTY